MMKNRFLINFNINNLERAEYDVVIIGGGISGLYTALQLPQEYKILIIAKENVENSNTALAQGGIAVSLGGEDSPKMHFDDTIFAGAGLCDEEAVWILVNEAKENIQNLVDYGVDFDRDSLNKLSLTREGAHSINRIIHAGDTTGKEVLTTLTEQVALRENIVLRTRYFAVDLLTQDKQDSSFGGSVNSLQTLETVIQRPAGIPHFEEVGVLTARESEKSCQGLILFDMNEQQFSIVTTPVVVCATGGYGQIYCSTTNPDVATGDGAALAYRAGAELCDLEFVQFHPTVLYSTAYAQEQIVKHGDGSKKSGFLISEALRGEGAILKNINGERFMSKYHELMELAPRDVVARAIFSEMKESGSDFVYLDITHKDSNHLKQRFPNIYQTLFDLGIDISKDQIPVSPAEHYCMGGIKTDISGRTAIIGFYACGECASNGIHGANRLASNSLLEGLVFGRIIARDILANKGILQKKISNINYTYNKLSPHKEVDYNRMSNSIKDLMSQYVGILRDYEGLNIANDEMEKYAKILNNKSCIDLISMEVQNMLLLSKLVIESAMERKESRGAHYRTDYPNCNNTESKKHIIKRIELEGQK